jgi:hypothetical protein
MTGSRKSNQVPGREVRESLGDALMGDRRHCVFIWQYRVKNRLKLVSHAMQLAFLILSYHRGRNSTSVDC